MKKVCLDTDFLVALLRNKREAVRKAEEYDLLNAETSTTSMNAFEVYLGAFRSKDIARNVRQADDLLNSINTLDLTLESSRKSGEIVSELLSSGRPIGLRDSIIAGIALVGGCTLVTRNVRHFEGITGLSIETW